MTRGRIIVLAANIKNKRGAVTYLRKRSMPTHPEHYTFAFVTEAHKRSGSLSNFRGSDYYTGPDKPGIGSPLLRRLTKNLTQDCGILVDRNLHDLGHGYQFLSPAAPGSPKIGHERWGQVELTEWGDTKIALICLHPIPIMQGRNPELLERYAMAMRWLEATIAAHRAQGHEVIVGGDVQVRVHADPQHSPKPIFAEHRMDWHWHGIDVIAWTPGLQLADRPKPRVIDDFKQATGHHWLKVALEVKPRRTR